MHEPGVDDDTIGGDDDEPMPNSPRVGEVFRNGYVWKGKVVRPAMVKVVG